MKKKITVGILAHVDAGKTTLSEALLYLSGKIRTLGRVDHKNTFLDTNAVERERGITIFSKQARFSWERCDFILLDTPGHVDFSPEAERTLSLLDYAILVISAPDGVQNHTRTLWQLLEFYNIPTFIFVNKCDIAIKIKKEIEEEIARTLSDKCVGFYEKNTKHELDEKLAVLNEDALEAFLAGEPIGEADIARLVARRQLFPCFFGAALKTEGVEYMLSTIDALALTPVYSDKSFGAKVYKIARDGALRLTYMKITGGCLSVRDDISYISLDGKTHSEKISQIRLYSGDKYKQTDSAAAGEICAVSGLTETYVGQGLGFEENSHAPILEPVLSYRLILPPECDVNLYFPKLKELEEEEPSLHLYWNEELRQIEAGIMGEIQTELLKRMIFERFGIRCEFGVGKILYKEKAAAKAIGIGHFEPLRHYAEVQLLIEPLPKGSGLVFDTHLPENTLATNWQRLILSHLYEKDHRGILTGSLLTDTKITLVAGKAHLKHTEGGDFREATLRGVRQGLMKAGCVLLEPYYRFRIELPSASVGRAMSDLQMRDAELEINNSDGTTTVIEGRAPVSKLHDYAKELISYTRGEGVFSAVPDGYYPCRDQESVVASFAYDPEADLENTPHSVFCANGAGFVVPWDQVDSYKHLEADIALSATAEHIIPSVASISKKYDVSNEELESIMMREFGPIRRKKYSEPKRISADQGKKAKPLKTVSPQKKMVIVDGYNLICSWDMLSELADFDLEKARDTLMDILSSYVAFTKTELVLVFDAYLVKKGVGSDFEKDGYRVVFTKEDQTADTFIEQMMHELGPNYNIRVVTGDRLVQYSAVHSGILRMTSKEFAEEITSVGNEITDFIRKLEAKNKK